MSEQIVSTEYSSEMQQSFIDYAMSVITARAVPDVRDGLKPVQRRVLYAMNELGLNADKPHRKSARIVGDAMGKYHPHGDSSIYEALVVMSQDFKKGMALVDGHGNFGSIEGDGAAAMRYTEARLRKFTQEVYLADLDKDVVNFVPNFDETEKEPEVLPVRVPNILVNGADGIAVGMVTSIAPHNLSEVIDAEIYLMSHPKATTAELLQFMPGPDFPTGGIVTNQKELLEIYETGRGKIKIRGKAEIVKPGKKSEKEQIVITEIPYPMVGANIGKFLSDVVALADSKKLSDIVDVSNQSSKEGIRIVIDLKKGADAERILQGLYKKTKLEDTFGVNMLAIADGKPEILGLKAILEHQIRFQEEINTRKYTTLLAKEKDRREVQEGLIRAVDIIDLIIEIIRGSKDVKMAKGCLMNGDTTGINFRHPQSKKDAAKLNFTERQATAILELRLNKLIGLEILALQKDYQETQEKIALYEKLLSDRKALRASIRQELERIKKAYAYKRRTVICDAEEAVYEEEAVPEVPGILSINRFGYVKLYEEALFARNEEAIREESRFLIPCMNTSRIIAFTREGNAHTFKLEKMPFARLKDKGVPIDNLCRYDSTQENLLAVFETAALSGREWLFVTAQGMVKFVEGTEFDIARSQFAYTKLADGDEVCEICETKKKHIILVTDHRRALRFQTKDIARQKRGAAGVRSMKLEADEKIAAVFLLDPKDDLTVKIGGKKAVLSNLRLKKRDATPQLL